MRSTTFLFCKALLYRKKEKRKKKTNKKTTRVNRCCTHMHQKFKNIKSYGVILCSHMKTGQRQRSSTREHHPRPRKTGTCKNL